MLPHWWMLKDTTIVRGFFEGMGGRIPWDVWLFPLMRWRLFFVGLWAIGYGASMAFSGAAQLSVGTTPVANGAGCEGA